MISSRPEFLENEHFRRNPKGRGKWKLTTLRTTRLLLDIRISETISFRDRNGLEWMRLEPTACGRAQMTIREGYSWDGATKVPDFGFFLETLVHDVLYQFRLTQHFPMSRRECDEAFLDLMKLSGKPRLLVVVYWRGVRMFGGAFKGQNGEWSKVITRA
jgi:hypothetical protein